MPMTIARQVAVATALAAGLSLLCGAVGLRAAIHHELGAWAPHFAMMQQMMGAAPSLSRLYQLVDLALSASCVIALVLAILLGAWFGRTIGKRVTEIDRGLAAFADGHLDRPVEEAGTEEMRRIAHSANAMAKRIQENRDREREMIAGLAHDLAHPLTALRNSLEAARDGLADGIEPDAADRLLRSVGNVEATLSDLRDVAAFDAGLIRLDWTVTAPSDIVEEAVEQYRYVASRRGVTLEARTEKALLVSTDRRRLGRIVANLIINALAATSPGGYVRVCARREGDRVILSVDDSAGTEASSTLRAALRDGALAGLGLRVVHALAVAIGVQVDVQATEAGSSVRIQLAQEPALRVLAFEETNAVRSR